ncbi:MAG: hypothetical protein ACI8RD_009089 [Bacillariaceae sp.]|jgi:hypothetical protein
MEFLEFAYGTSAKCNKNALIVAVDGIKNKNFFLNSAL